MKRIICILIASSILSTVAYAGQWQQDETGWRYQNDDGSYKTGWIQNTDGQWYYLSDESTYMLTSTTTPDGYLVSDTGAWQDESNLSAVEYNGYDNKISLDVRTYSSPGGNKTLDYTLPVSIYYNNKYDGVNSGSLTITKISLSDDGVPCFAFTGNTGEVYALNFKYRYYFSDGSYTDDERSLLESVNDDNDESIDEFRMSVSQLRKSPVSIDIWIDTGTLD